MSNDLIALPVGGNLPAHLAASVADIQANNELTGHGGTGFPVMSIKGKVFTLRRGGEDTLIMNPNDPDAPASAIEVVLIRANDKNSKTFYSSAYVEGSDASPDCMSEDGIRPDASSPAPQCATCAACPHNVWGSRISDDGRKGKACQDNIRMAIAAPGQLNDPMLLRVPPASIRPLTEYGSALSKRGVPYYAVVTKLGFDHTVATPKLTLKAVSYLTAEQYAEAKEMRDSDLVAQIIGIGGSADALGAAPAFVEAPVVAAPAVPAAPVPAAPVVTPAPAPTPAPAAAKPAARAGAKKATLAAVAAAPVVPAPVVQATSPGAAAGAAAAAAGALSEVESMLASLDATDD